MSSDDTKELYNTKTRDVVICIGVYLAALVSALVAGYLIRDLHPLVVVAVADVVATIVIFLFSVAFDNSSLYDPYWSVAPLPIVIYYLSLSPDGLFSARRILVTLCIAVWGIRLTYNWLRGWSGLHHEDWRYVMIRRKTGKWYWPASFASIHFFPTVMVYLGCLSVYAVNVAPAVPLHLLDVFAALVVIMAIWFEMTADRQLFRFRLERDSSRELFEEGLWGLCRHPNYFGEVSFWWGLFFFSLATGLGNYWTIIGPVVMTVLFVFISVPMIDRRMMERKSGYETRMRTVRALIPIPRRKSET